MAVAIVLSLVLSPVVAFLARLHVPRPIGALLVLAILVATLALGFLQLAAPAAEWIDNAPRIFSQLERKLVPVGANAHGRQFPGHAFGHVGMDAIADAGWDIVSRHRPPVDRLGNAADPATHVLGSNRVDANGVGRGPAEYVPCTQE